MALNGLKTCGVGIRGVAMAIDSFVWFGLFLSAVTAVGAATGQIETTASGVNTSLEGTNGMIGFGLWLALGIGYHTIFEWQFGKTMGKYLVGIKVTTYSGSGVSLLSSLVRNIFRLVDFLPVFYVVGIVMLLVTGRDQRIGDKFGRTVVTRT
jgi:uncharacterized RDD family membrane protein YckC